MRKYIIYLSITCIACILVGVYVYRVHTRQHLLDIYVFSADIGHAYIVRTPRDMRILVNGGSNSGIIRELTSILPFYSRHIDALIATNTEGRNVSGLIDIVGRYTVDRLYIPAYTLENMNLASSSDEIYHTLIHTAQSRGVDIYEVKEGDRITLDQASVVIDVLFPAQPQSFVYSRASAPDIVSALSYRNTQVVFMAGVSMKIQKYISQQYPEHIGQTRVLVVSHAATAATLAYETMLAVDPDIIVYSRSPEVSTSRTKPQADPLAHLLARQRFNLRNGGVHIISDDDSVNVHAQSTKNTPEGY